MPRRNKRNTNYEIAQHQAVKLLEQQLKLAWWETRGPKQPTQHKRPR